ncbi:MAG TPA: hypothetical protein VIK04_10410 [Solirubrobacteraceae bacterium]
MPFKRLVLVPGLALLALVGASGASAASGTGRPPSQPSSTATIGAASTGGAGVGAPSEPASTRSRPTVPGDVAKIIRGVAYAPSFAPKVVKEAIWAGNVIRTKPYIYGGGHGRWKDAGYDCSGSVSYVLHAAGLLRTSMDSGEFESWGRRGLGQWITVYTNPAHAFVEIAGIRLDTSAQDDPKPPPGSGPRWRPVMARTRGFRARHPSSL